MRSVREREREREREIQRQTEVTSPLSRWNWRWVYTFPCQKLATDESDISIAKNSHFSFLLHTSRLSLPNGLEFRPLCSDKKKQLEINTKLLEMERDCAWGFIVVLKFATLSSDSLKLFVLTLSNGALSAVSQSFGTHHAPSYSVCTSGLYAKLTLTRLHKNALRFPPAHQIAFSSLQFSLRG